ncbi:methylmalonyl Co-A mutase-associated GTPase MeaB [Cyclobacterium sp.]|uniref:methylmalonyl Co-A mutase-associated GTPase MeaB n=1 Tax=Cyclobacterium sp. TaxID=1966343 RepID=UPI0019861CB6|nr:methylmalonyl Co-A mutase-associated GTPase MeaB [Cyclobacterium sp.]MBD3629399.1 methylmalonyl Co-A mutase-associated GTPase MeaB [Cyclobacterium sp.]
MVAKRYSVAQYVAGILAGNRSLLSQSISLVESELEADRKLANQLIGQVLPLTGNALRIGISGIPGVGKSTFINSFGELLLSKGHKTAVLTVDPSSGKSRGSILADKTRMETLSHHPSAYVRPSPAGKNLGGISAKTRETMLLCEAAGFDRILVETVGVGQSETSVKEMVDVFLLLMITGAGDELQGIKRGIMEWADIFVINKADGANAPEAEKMKQALQTILPLISPAGKAWDNPVKTCSALNGKGMVDLLESLDVLVDKMKDSGHFQQTRKSQQRQWLEDHISFLLLKKFNENNAVELEKQKAIEILNREKANPIGLAEELVRRFFEKNQ